MDMKYPMKTQTTPRKSSLLKFFFDLKIGTKLSIGFGLLLAIILINAVGGYSSNSTATTKIGKTDEVYVPSMVTASKAQANLLRMLGDVRGYLALGEPIYRENYQSSVQAFENDLAELKKILGDQDSDLLHQLEDSYAAWKPLPEQLFELRDDQLDREPAYRRLATEGVTSAGNVIIDVNSLINQQDQNEPSLENQSLMADTAKFQGTFQAMLSALRGYVTTRNPIYRGEYEVNLTDNENTWVRLLDQKNKMSIDQQQLLDRIATNRADFLKLPAEIFGVLESEEWRTDLYDFKTKAVPLAEKMIQSLDTLVINQEKRLESELSAGRNDLNLSNQLIIISGVIALLFGVLMSWTSRNLIAAPIGRLTNVAEQIRGGDLHAQAQVESRDEIGILASTFNNMTGKMRQTLVQVRKEKKRADDLLDVVIPIGVDLTTEKNFNRLLEKMLMEAKTFCHADTGILYMSTVGKGMEFVIVRSDSRNLALGGTSENEPLYAPLPFILDSGKPNDKNAVVNATLNGSTLNFGEAAQINEFNLWGDDEKNQDWNSYVVASMLIIPLKNSEDKVLGVLQLINPTDPETHSIIAFDENLQRMMESFSSLAIAALEAYTREFKLKQEIQQLRIEIDEAKQKQQVKEIVDTELFQNLAQRAKILRLRRQTGKDQE